jgi:hypothetical protein
MVVVNNQQPGNYAVIWLLWQCAVHCRLYWELCSSSFWRLTSTELGRCQLPAAPAGSRSHSIGQGPQHLLLLLLLLLLPLLRAQQCQRQQQQQPCRGLISC